MPRHRGEQHRGPEGVDRHVRRQVGHVDAQADLGRLVHHGVGSGDRAGDGVLIPHVAHRDVLAAAQVESSHLMPGVAQQPGDAAPDETGRAGDHDLHLATVSAPCPGESFTILTERPAGTRPVL